MATNSAKPDIKIVVGNTGGAAPHQGSAKLIRDNLQKAMGVQHPVKIHVTIDPNALKKIRADIESALSGVMVGKTTQPSGTTATSSSATGATEAANSSINKLTQTRVRHAGAMAQENAQSAQRASTSHSEAAAVDRVAAAALKASQQTSQGRLQLQKFNAYLQTLKPKALTEFSTVIAQIRQGLGSGIPAEVQKAKVAFANFRADMQQLGYENGNLFTMLGKKAKQFATYLVSSVAITAVYSGIRNVISTVKELDEALTDLRIVTGGTKNDAEKLLGTYNQMARELGSTTSSVAKAAVEWQRQGYSLADTNQLIKDSMVLSVVGMIDSTEAAQYLTSAMKGYQVEAANAIDIVDRLTAVDLVAAVSAGGLAEAMARTANSARLAGVDMSNLVGYIAAVGEVTQRDMSTVGEAFKTMFARYGNVKLGVMTDEESGESLNDFEKVLGNIGIALRDQSGQFRDFDDVIVELSNSWKSLSDVEKNAVASTLGGMRQRENVLVLLENMDKALKYAGVAANSSGTAMQKFSVYEESVEYKTNQLTSATEKFATTILDSGLLKGVLDLGIFALDAATGFLSLGGAFGGVVGDIALLTTSLITLTSVFNMLKASGLGVAFTKTFKDLGWPEMTGDNIVPIFSEKAA